MQLKKLNCETKQFPVLVEASVVLSEHSIAVDFFVRESPSCFCCKHKQDGEFVWQDSCVEVFLKMLDGSEDYANFEFNSKGVCYAARGKNRQSRTELTKNEYAQITRKPSGVNKEGDFLCWALSVEIPRELLFTEKDLRTLNIEGNLYKCADHAAEPHYFSAFPVNTPKPDFHRPEFFLPLLFPMHK